LLKQNLILALFLLRDLHLRFLLLLLELLQPSVAAMVGEQIRVEGARAKGLVLAVVLEVLLLVFPLLELRLQEMLAAAHLPQKSETLKRIPTRAVLFIICVLLLLVLPLPLVAGLGREEMAAQEAWAKELVLAVVLEVLQLVFPLLELHLKEMLKRQEMMALLPQKGNHLKRCWIPTPTGLFFFFKLTPAVSLPL